MLALVLAIGAALTLAAPAHEPPPVETVGFDELLDPGPKLAISRKALALAGRRVRLVGFMVKMELPPRGAFYLAPRPLFIDESGGGTGDLPPHAVRVVVRSSPDEELPWVPRPLEVTGVLEVGNSTDADGRVSAFRIVLDRREDVGAPSEAPAPRSQRSTPHSQ